MQETDLARRRYQMGASLRALVEANAPAGKAETGPGYWLMLSGEPSPDVNLALVYAGDPSTVDRVRHKVEAEKAPTLLALAGPAVGQAAGGTWQRVGFMPFMACPLEGQPFRSDPRVRPATSDDFGVVSRLLAEAFGMEVVTAEAVARVLDVDGLESLHVWVLEDDREAVSTVITSLVEDAVCVWCMGTPTRFGRRGFARALLGHVLLQARRAGATLGLLGATPAGQPLYEATGWETLEDWHLYLRGEVSVQFGS